MAMFSLARRCLSIDLSSGADSFLTFSLIATFSVA
jgi:hypothetical protein